jgi:predicted permease
MRLRDFYRTFFRRSRLDRDLDDELRAYLDVRIATRTANGIDPAEARRQVLAEEGGLDAVREGARDVRAGAALATVAQDLRFGARTLRRSPGFAVVACLTLALGVGASVAMFTILRSVLWRPLPYPDAERLVVVDADVRGIAGTGATAGEVGDFAERSRTLERIAIFNGVEAHVVVDDEVERVGAASVSDDLLPMLGARAAHGRLLDYRLDTDDVVAHSVVISDALWRRRFGADPHVVGRSVTVNNVPRRIVGVLAPGLRLFLPAALTTSEVTDVWFANGISEDRSQRGHGVVARLTPTSTAADAERELNALGSQFAAEHPAAYSGAAVRFRVAPIRQLLTQHVDGGLQMLGGAVGFVLLLSCVNLANLLLARGSGRERELALRRALGATRARVMRQLITESLLLSVLGSALGLVASRFAVTAVDWLRPAHLPRQSQIAMDPTVAMFAVGVTIAAGLLFGVLPAWRLAGRDAAAPLQGRGGTIGAPARRLQRTLVIAEVALSIVPLVAAGLLVRSFVNLAHAPLGIQAANVLTAWMPISFRQFREFEARWQLHREALAQIRALPGVEAVSAVSPVPYGPHETKVRYGRTGDGPPVAVATMQSVLPGYFDVVRTRVIQGRDFSDDDLATGRQVVVIDERIARQFWPDGALGQQIVVAQGTRLQTLEIVGVTATTRVRHVREDGLPHVFLPYHLWSPVMALAIRTSASAETLAPAIHRTVASLGTQRAVDVRPLSAFVANSMAETRFTMLVLLGFAGAALLLAGVGLYGTLAYLTSQRLREFGIRLALGATRREILTLVAREGLALAAVGVAAGAVGAAIAALSLRHLLYDVGPLDPVTLAAVTGLVGLVAVVASFKPAWTAGCTNPLIALRAE